jgi:fused signal recognition particle receptor
MIEYVNNGSYINHKKISDLPGNLLTINSGGQQMAQDEKKKSFFSGFMERFGTKKTEPRKTEEKEDVKHTTTTAVKEKKEKDETKIQHPLETAVKEEIIEQKAEIIEQTTTEAKAEAKAEAEAVKETTAEVEIVKIKEIAKTEEIAKIKEIVEATPTGEVKDEEMIPVVTQGEDKEKETLPETSLEEKIQSSKQVVSEAQGPTGWFKKLSRGLDKTRKSFVFKMKGLFRLRNVIDEEFWEELEDILITADVGLETTEYIVGEMKKAVDEHYISEPSQLLEVMKEKLRSILDEKPAELNTQKNDLTVIMVVGVNGTGKTTSIAKIANRLKEQGKKVIIAAADTFRAAAIEQLEVWTNKVGLELVKHKEGADPAAVVFDAVNAAKARKADVLIIDTAGRLHSKVNLMKELEKIKRVIKRSVTDAPHETLLVLDATTGQNALIQTKTFREFVDISGIVLTKLDGTAKGGMIIGIVHEQGIPVKFIGVGETVDDLRPFESKQFIDALFSESDER